MQITDCSRIFQKSAVLFRWLAYGLLAWQITPAAAHPHVFITGQTKVIFGAQGQITALRHSWVFDDMYSAFATQGLGQKGGLATARDLAPLAKNNIEGLAEFDYFSHAKADGVKVEFGAPSDYSLEERADRLIVLQFTLPLKAPLKAAKIVSIQIYDPTYFVAFKLAPEDPVTLVNAPAGCSDSVIGSNPLAANETKKLSEAFFSGLSPGADFGIKLASRIIIACP